MSIDASVLVSTDLARRVVDAIPFPIRLVIPGSRETDINEEVEIDIQIPSGDVAPYGDTYIADISTTFQTTLVELAKRARDGTLNEASVTQDELAALKVLADAAKEVGNEESGIFKADPHQIKDALQALITRKTITIEVEWIKVDIGKPNIALGNPIELADMNFDVLVRVKGCLHLGGWTRCVHVTIGWLHFHAAKGLLELSGQGAGVYELPQFVNLDFIIDINLFGVHFRIKIGLTRLANKLLRKQGPSKLMDLSSFEQDVPYSSKKLRVASLSFPQNTAGLEVAAAMVIE